MTLLHRLVLAAALPLAACAGRTPAAGGAAAHGAAGAAGAPCTFTNPVGRGADPWVLRDGGHYYLAQSDARGIHVYRSDTLTRPLRHDVVVWRPPGSGWNARNVWAPELHHIGRRWYIYYAAGQAGPPFVWQRAGVLESTADDPQGAYVDRGQLYTGDSIATHAGSRWAIDLTVDTIGGQLYAVWSGWDRDTTSDRTPQSLFIARMASPTAVATSRVKLAAPTAPWEVGTKLDLEEGPEFLRHAGRTFVVYSTRESWLPDYRLGMLTLVNPAAPLDPASWAKSGPVLTRSATVFGPGHASFTTSEDGTEDWIVYHAKVDSLGGWNRVIRMQRFAWRADGTPDFGAPLPDGVPIPDPSGECR